MHILLHDMYMYYLLLNYKSYVYIYIYICIGIPMHTCTTRNFGGNPIKCNSAISPGFPVSSAPRAIVAAPRPPATPGRIQCRLVGPKKNSWCRPGPQWSPTRVSSRLLQVALGVKRAGVSGPDGLQNAPRLKVLRTWHLRRA